MPDSFAGITVPEGEPSALEAGAARLEGLAGRMDGIQGQLVGMPGALAGWAGPASIAYQDGTLTNGAATSAAAAALQATAQATRTYAGDLEAAQTKAERAIEDARDAQRRIDAAEGAIADAQARRASASTSLGTAELTIFMTGLTGTPDAAAQADATAAREAISNADADESAARRRLEAARSDLEDAKRRGARAEDEAEEAGTTAAHAYSGAGITAPLVARPGSAAMPRESALSAPRHPLWGRAGLPGGPPQLTESEQERLRLIEDAREEAEDEGKPPGEGGIWGFVHGGLDVGGFIPGAGAIPDLINAGLYGARGKGEEAAWAAGAAVPLVGDAAKGGKMLYKGGKALEAGADGTRALPPRPGWRQSETDVGRANPGHAPQRAFKDGVEVSPRTKGSVRPDYYAPRSAIEVKNYEVVSSQGRERLVGVVTSQAVERAAHLPEGTVQRVVVDIRGQDVPLEVGDSLVERIVRRSGGVVQPEDITFIR